MFLGARADHLVEVYDFTIERPGPDRAILSFNVIEAEAATLRIAFGGVHNNFSYDTGTKRVVMEAIGSPARGDNTVRITVVSGWCMLSDVVIW